MRNPLNFVLLFIPIALMARFVLHAPPLAVFVASALAIVPLAKWTSRATEELAVRTGPGVGALLNASFGTSTELIIALFALRAGLIDVVKASITGSIIGNMLFVLGWSMLIGGRNRERQEFNRTAAGVAGSQLALALVALFVPATFAAAHPLTPTGRELIESELVAGLLIAAYGLSLLFSLRTHPQLYQGAEAESHQTAWSMKRGLLVLAAATIGVAFMAETLVESVEGVTTALGWSELFIGIILLPLVGNAAELLTAVSVASKDQMDLSLGIAFGASLQVALLITPILVFAGTLFGHPMNLLFRPTELVAIASAVGIANLIALDGESNWLEGVQLLIVWSILGVAFFVYS